jgi:hypothetical protein
MIRSASCLFWAIPGAESKSSVTRIIMAEITVTNVEAQRLAAREDVSCNSTVLLVTRRGRPLAKVVPVFGLRKRNHHGRTWAGSVTQLVADDDSVLPNEAWDINREPEVLRPIDSKRGLRRRSVTSYGCAEGMVRGEVLTLGVGLVRSGSISVGFATPKGHSIGHCVESASSPARIWSYIRE